MAEPGRARRWILAGLIALVIVIYIVLNWRAVSEPLSGILRALSR